jgi:hypothetical protein
VNDERRLAVAPRPVADASPAASALLGSHSETWSPSGAAGSRQAGQIWSRGRTGSPVLAGAHERLMAKSTPSSSGSWDRFGRLARCLEQRGGVWNRLRRPDGSVRGGKKFGNRVFGFWERPLCPAPVSACYDDTCFQRAKFAVTECAPITLDSSSSPDAWDQFVHLRSSRTCRNSSGRIWKGGPRGDSNSSWDWRDQFFRLCSSRTGSNSCGTPGRRPC